VGGGSTNATVDLSGGHSKLTLMNAGGARQMVLTAWTTNATVNSGLTLTNVDQIRGTSDAALLIDTSGAAPIVFGTNNTEQARFTPSVGFKMTAARFEHAMGANVASASTLTLGVDGTIFGITGTTIINYITTTNWQAGSIVTLRFAAACPVHNNVGSVPGSTAPILLAGGGDTTFAANTILTLLYDGANWIDVRKVT
jgi:hypothetical protein